MKLFYSTYYLFIKARIDHLIRYFFCKEKFVNTFLKSKPNKNLSEALFDKYHEILGGNYSTYSKIWTNVLSESYKDIYSSLNKMNKRKFTYILNNFFQEKSIRGAEDGDLFKKFNFEISHKFLLIQGIYRLSEYMGYKKIINPYQFYEKNKQSINIRDYYKNLSNKFPIIEIPNVGSPYGLKIDKGVINYRFIESIYFNLEIKNFVLNQKEFISKKMRVLEIGSGSGMNILVTFKFLKDYIEKIYLVDLPEMLLFQEYFLRSSLTDKDFKKIDFIPNNKFQYVNLNYNVLINKDSLPEISKSQSEMYLNSFNNTNGCYFFSLNQESGITDQIPVSDLVKKHKNIHKISRSLFPLKRGYVKEIFISKFN